MTTQCCAVCTMRKQTVRWIGEPPIWTPKHSDALQMTSKTSCKKGTLQSIIAQNKTAGKVVVICRLRTNNNLSVYWVVSWTLKQNLVGNGVIVQHVTQKPSVTNCPGNNAPDPTSNGDYYEAFIYGPTVVGQITPFTEDVFGFRIPPNTMGHYEETGLVGVDPNYNADTWCTDPNCQYYANSNLPTRTAPPTGWSSVVTKTLTVDWCCCAGAGSVDASYSPKGF